MDTLDLIQWPRKNASYKSTVATIRRSEAVENKNGNKEASYARQN